MGGDVWSDTVVAAGELEWIVDLLHQLPLIAMAYRQRLPIPFFFPVVKKYIQCGWGGDRSGIMDVLNS
jgi:hypothetical protein